MKDKLLLGLIGVVGLVVVLLGARLLAPQAMPFGSVGETSEYVASTTRNYRGDTIQTLTVLKSGPGTLGSIVITGAAAGQINLFDATSTMTNTNWATTTIATIPLSAAAGTYTFDAVFSKGLMYEIIGVAPTSTITWR